MIGIASCILFVYVLLLVLALMAWKSNPTTNTSSISNELISVIVPFRNEEKDLKKCLFSLVDQQETGSIEIILINDHSTDQSLAIANQFAQKHERIQVHSLPGNAEQGGKKRALEFAISISKGSIILQTDADCVTPPLWVNKMRNNFNSKLDLLLGPVKVNDNELPWNWINQLEMMTLQLITAGTVHYKRPTMANGANLMYTKKIYLNYLNSGIGRDFASGDDQHLLDYAVKTGDNNVEYLKDKAAIIETNFPCEWEEMVNQRARWASKNKQATGTVKYLGILFVSIQFTFPALLFFSIFSPSFLPYAWYFIVIKSLIEIAALYFVNHFFNCSSIKYSLVFPFVYPYFLVRVALKTNKQGTWKNRSI